MKNIPFRNLIASTNVCILLLYVLKGNIGAGTNRFQVTFYFWLLSLKLWLMSISSSDNFRGPLSAIFVF